MPPPPPPPDRSGRAGDAAGDAGQVQAPVSLADLLRDRALARGLVPAPWLTNPPGSTHQSPLRRWAHAVAHPWRASSASLQPASPPGSLPSSPALPHSLPRTSGPAPRKEVSFEPRLPSQTSVPAFADAFAPSSAPALASSPSPSSSLPSSPTSRFVSPGAASDTQPPAASPLSSPSRMRPRRISAHLGGGPDEAEERTPLISGDLSPALGQEQNTPHHQGQHERVRWIGVLCALAAAQVGWTFGLVYASPVLLASGLSLTQVAAVWLAYATVSLGWRLLVPCEEEKDTDIPLARHKLLYGTLVSVLGLMTLGKVDALANQLARLGGGVGDWDPVRIRARILAGQVLTICALGVLESGSRRMRRTAHTLVTHVPHAWRWTNRTAFDDPRIDHAQCSAPVPGVGAVSHFATISGFLLAGVRLSVWSDGALDWFLAPPSEPDEESQEDRQVRRLCAVLVILLSVLSGTAWIASRPLHQPIESPLEPASALPPPPPTPRRSVTRTSLWSTLVPFPIRLCPQGGPKYALAQVGMTVRLKGMDAKRRKIYVAHMLVLVAWSPFAWFGSAFLLWVRRTAEKDRHRFRPGPPSLSFFGIESSTYNDHDTLDVPSIAWDFACFALVSGLTSWSIFFASHHPARFFDVQPSTLWITSTLLAAVIMMCALWVRNFLEAGIWLALLGLPWSLLRTAPGLLVNALEPWPAVPSLHPQSSKPSSSRPPSSATRGPNTSVNPINPAWRANENRSASSQQRISWHSLNNHAGANTVRGGSLQSGRTSMLSNQVPPSRGATTTQPMHIPSSPEEVRPPEALARAREMQAGFAFRPTDEGVSPASLSFSSPALHSVALPTARTPGPGDKVYSTAPGRDGSQGGDAEDQDGSDLDSSPPESPVDEEPLSSTPDSDEDAVEHRPSRSSFLISTPPNTAVSATIPQAALSSEARKTAHVQASSPVDPTPSNWSSSVRNSYRAPTTAQKSIGRRSMVPSLQSLPTAVPDLRPDSEDTEDGARNDYAARQAVARALTHCAPLPGREDSDLHGGECTSDPPQDLEGMLASPTEGSDRAPTLLAGVPPAGPFEIGDEVGINPRLAPLVPQTIVRSLTLFLS